MKRILFIIVSVVVGIGIASFSITHKNQAVNNIIKKSFSKVEIKNLLEPEDPTFSIRAIEIDNNRIWFGGANGYYGNWDLFDKDPLINSSNVFTFGDDDEDAYEGNIIRFMDTDTTGYEIRAIAKIDDSFITLTAGSPAILTKYYENQSYRLPIDNRPEAFWDSIDFWNDQEGIAIGDPMDGCMSIIITRDGGNNWEIVSCEDLPEAKEGEAAFAASDSNIAIVGDHTWIATGGKASRILYSADKGKTWTVYETPIIQGKETTGMYSIDFYDENNGFAIGGDYTKPNERLNNKIRTIDGGKTWQVVSNGKGPGYRSCIQYVPNSNGKELVAIGFKGIDYSDDSGESWKHLSDEGFYTIRFLNDSIAYAAGKGRISKLTFKE